MRIERLFEGTAAVTIEVKTRFLQVVTRQDWQEGREREASLAYCTLESLATWQIKQRFVFEGVDESVKSATLEVGLDLAATELEENLYKITLVVRNLGQ